MKKFIFLIVLTVSFMLGASNVLACSCIVDMKQSTNKKIKVSYKESTVVFSGEVTEITRQSGLAVKFKVYGFWKGQIGDEVIVRTAEDSGMCGFAFQVGKRYLVYASDTGNSLHTTICSRTSESNADAKYLNKIKKPVYIVRGPKLKTN
jgi:hypothetical protein